METESNILKKLARIGVESVFSIVNICFRQGWMTRDMRCYKDVLTYNDVSRRIKYDNLLPNNT